jgi:hypothetical protein
MLQNDAVQEATSSKNGPHRQSSSAFGSQSDIAAAWFQQSVYKDVSHCPEPATCLPPMGARKAGYLLDIFQPCQVHQVVVVDLVLESRV